MTKISLLLLALTIWNASAVADVTDSNNIGFTVAHEVTVDATRAAAWQAAVHEVGEWWSDDHTVTGEASRLSIEPKPLGCFCEALGNDAGVVHLTVTFVNPTILLRLSGGLGPLGLMGTNGNMTWEFDDTDDGTRIRFTYVVGGYRPGGMDGIAVPVDGVIGEALARLKAHIENDGALDNG
jgi:hypothetical protein